MNRDLLYRFFDRNVSAFEEKQVLDWVDESDANYQEYLNELKIFSAIILHGDNTLEVSKSQVETTKSKTASVVNYLYKAVAGIAAAVMITLSTLYIIDSYKSPNVNKIIVPQGQHVNVVLADGTKVGLNSMTTLEYPQHFKGRERKVTIDGEAYFEVAKSKSHPFVVNTSKGEVEVLGTKFYVNSYSNNDIFKTSLVEGKVRISSGDETIVLLPNNEAYLEDGKLLCKPIGDYEAFRWMEGLYCFKNELFMDVLKKLENYYSVKFVFEDDNLPNPVMTGKFRILDGVEHALKTLQHDVRYRYSIHEESGIITIMKK